MTNELLAEIARQRQENRPQSPQHVQISSDPHQEERLIKGIGGVIAEALTALSNTTQTVRVQNHPGRMAVSVEKEIEVSGMDRLLSEVSRLADETSAKDLDDGSDDRRHGDLLSAILSLKAEIAKIDVRPQVSVSSPEVSVSLSPVTSAIRALSSKVDELIALESREPEEEDEEEEARLVGYDLERTNDGRLDSITERWTNGTRKAVGFATGRIRITDDRTDR